MGWTDFLVNSDEYFCLIAVFFGAAILFDDLHRHTK